MNRSPLLRTFKSCLSVAFLLLPAASAWGQSETRRDPQPQVTYPLGEDSLPQAGVPEGRLEGPFLFRSQIIENTVRKYWVYVPAQYSADKPAAVLVFQDGARAINPTGVIRVPQVLENLIAKKQIPVTIGVFITPGQRGDEFPDSIGTGNPNNRDLEYDVLDDKYARMVIEEILPEVEKKYPLSDNPRDRAIGGSSSGAICAFTVAWQRPQEFQNVISFIGSFTNIHGGHVYPQLVRESEMKPIRIFLQDGVNDLRSPNNLERDWHIQNQKMVAAFQEKGYDMAYVFGEGGHSDDHGGAMLPQMLRWIWRDHPDVDPPQVDLVAEAKAIQPEQNELFPGYNADILVDPSGAYSWENRFGNMTTVSSLSIAQENGQITGTYRMQRGDEEAVEIPIERPEMQGNKLLFDVTTQFRGQDMTSTYQGIVSDRGIEGWRLMDFGGQARDFRWTAERVKNNP
ncbi:MAG: alpha/beta hydrolase-fold protein [bacterium]|nr:alpha/beta hydrolase-fold protein [bacterium]